MRYKVHSLVTVILGMATPVLMGWGTSSVLEGLYDKEQLGHGTPVEFLLILILLGLFCLGIFIIFNIISSTMYLPKDGRRKKHFLLALLLYFFIVLFGWLILAILERGIEMLVSSFPCGGLPRCRLPKSGRKIEKVVDSQMICTFIT